MLTVLHINIWNTFLKCFFIALINLLESIILFEIFDVAMPLKSKSSHLTDSSKEVEKNSAMGTSIVSALKFAVYFSRFQRLYFYQLGLLNLALYTYQIKGTGFRGLQLCITLGKITNQQINLWHSSSKCKNLIERLTLFCLGVSLFQQCWVFLQI